MTIPLNNTRNQHYKCIIYTAIIPISTFTHDEGSRIFLPGSRVYEFQPSEHQDPSRRAKNSLLEKQNVLGRG